MINNSTAIAGELEVAQTIGPRITRIEIMITRNKKIQTMGALHTRHLCTAMKKGARALMVTNDMIRLKVSQQDITTVRETL